MPGAVVQAHLRGEPGWRGIRLLRHAQAGRIADQGRRRDAQVELKPRPSAIIPVSRMAWRSATRMAERAGPRRASALSRARVPTAACASGKVAITTTRWTSDRGGIRRSPSRTPAQAHHRRPRGDVDVGSHGRPGSAPPRGLSDHGGHDGFSGRAEQELRDMLAGCGDSTRIGGGTASQRVRRCMRNAEFRVPETSIMPGAGQQLRRRQRDRCGQITELESQAGTSSK